MARVTSWRRALVLIILIILPVLCLSCSLRTISPSEMRTKSRYPYSCPQRTVSSSIYKRQKICFFNLTFIVMKKLTGSSLKSKPFVHPMKICCSVVKPVLHVVVIAHLICSFARSGISFTILSVSWSRTQTRRSGPSARINLCRDS